MKYLILSLLALSMSAFSADKMQSAPKSKMNTDNSKTLDINPKTKAEEMADQTATLTDKEFANAQVICKKAKDGKELKEGDEGYDACLKKVKHGKKINKGAKAKIEVKFEK